MIVYLFIFCIVGSFNIW